MSLSVLSYVKDNHLWSNWSLREISWKIRIERRKLDLFNYIYLKREKMKLKKKNSFYQFQEWIAQLRIMIYAGILSLYLQWPNTITGFINRQTLYKDKKHINRWVQIEEVNYNLNVMVKQWRFVCLSDENIPTWVLTFAPWRFS